MPIIHIMIGLQASGKSTFCKEHFGDDVVYISKDTFRKVKNRKGRQEKLILEAAREGRSIVVDNTNPEPIHRKQIIELVTQYNYLVYGYYMDTGLALCIDRNESRLAEKRVPKIGVLATFKRLMKPTYEEGFHKIFNVSCKAGNKFEITDYLEPINEK